MAFVPEISTWSSGVYQFELTDPVQGGPDGIDNLPLRQLANRTVFLRDGLEALQTSFSGLPATFVTSVAGRYGAVTLEKADVGLGSVENYPVASQAEAQAGTAANRYMTPQRVAQAIAQLVPGAPVTSVAGRTGAVTLTKADVGLGSVENYPVASQAEAQSGSATNRYMTPQRVAQAIAQLVPGAPVTSVAGRTGAVTLAKADVGLGSVDNTADSAKSVQSAARLATARTINGTSFDGTTNITTSAWGSPRTVTIGAAAKSVDGSANVAWTLAEMGAQAALPTATEAEAQAGTSTALRNWSPSLIKSAISALDSSSIAGASSGLSVKNNTANPGAAIDLSAEEIVLKNSAGQSLVVTGVALTANIAVSGINGLDTGSAAANTWYYLWVISNGTTKAALISASASAPTMPSGYTYKARVSTVYRTSAFRRFVQAGHYIQAAESWQTLSVGSATGMTAVSMAAFVPPIHKQVTIDVMHGTPASSGQGGTAIYSGNSSSKLIGSITPFSTGSVQNDSNNFTFLPEVSQTYYYLVTKGSSSHYVISYVI